MTFRCNTKAEYAALDKLLNTGRTLLLQDTLGRQFYMSFGDATYEFKASKSIGVEPAGYWHDITVKATEVERPPG